MASNSSSEIMHKQLIMTMGRYLPITSQEFKDFKRILPLEPRDKADNCESAEDLLEVWQRREGFGLDNYTKLIWVLEQAQSLNELLKTIRKRVADIEQQLQIESRAVPNPVEQAPDPPDENDGSSLQDYYT